MSRALLQQALDALTYQGTMGPTRRQRRHAAIADLQAALAQPEPEKAKPLTREQALAIVDGAGYSEAQERADFLNGLRHGEAAHGIRPATATPQWSSQISAMNAACRAHVHDLSVRRLRPDDTEGGES